MRIKCSFTLEPAIYECHRDAESSLRQWKDQLQISNYNVDIVRERVNNFHRQIYLSGLYLHNLAPELPLMLSQNFTQDVESKTFFNLLAAVGVTAETKAAEPISTEAVLSELQWQKLTGLVNDIIAQQSQAAEQQVQQFDQLKAQYSEPAQDSDQDNTDIVTQLAAVAASQEQIINQLAALDGLQNTAATPDDALLFTLKQNQTKALSQLKAIRSQIDKLSSAGMVSVEKDEVPDLNDQLSKASRVKAKGLW